MSPFGEIRRFHLEIGHSRESCRSVKKIKIEGRGVVVVFFNTHCTCVESAQLSIYSIPDECGPCGRMSSTHAQYHLLYALCLNIHLAHALLYANRPHGLKKLPARGWDARLSASPLDDENDVMRTVRGRGRPKYTLVSACKSMFLQAQDGETPRV